MEVEARIKCCSDLVVVESVYHKHCYNRFHFGTGTDLTGRESVQNLTTSCDAHRPMDETKLALFNRMCE